jgi:hypothetical protein
MSMLLDFSGRHLGAAIVAHLFEYLLRVDRRIFRERKLIGWRIFWRWLYRFSLHTRDRCRRRMPHRRGSLAAAGCGDAHDDPG